MVTGTQTVQARTWPREATVSSDRRGADRPRGWRTGQLLLDAGILLALVYLLPFVILLFGAPIALALKALLRLAGVR